MVAHTEEYVVAHTALLAEIDSRSKSNVKRLDKLDNQIEVINSLALSLNSLAMAVDSQSKDLSLMVKRFDSHEQKIDSLEDKMETKDTVSALQNEVDEMRKLIDDKETTQREQKLAEYENMKRFITKVLLGTAVFIIGAITLFGAVMLTALAKTGALPTP